MQTHRLPKPEFLTDTHTHQTKTVLRTRTNYVLQGTLFLMVPEKLPGKYHEIKKYHESKEIKKI